MAFVLFGMHIYWTYCLIKSAIISLNKDTLVNEYDAIKKQWFFDILQKLRKMC